MSDQITATMTDVLRRCGANRHLIEDRDIEGVVLFALGARPSIEDMTNELNFGGRMLGRGPRVFRRYANRASCDRCLNDWNGGDGRLLEVPAGASIVRVWCCPACVAFLDEAFAPVTWKI